MCSDQRNGNQIKPERAVLLCYGFLKECTKYIVVSME